MSREITITYGSTSFGGSTAREITDWVTNVRKFEEFSIEFEFYIYKTTEAAFITEIATVEEALRTPFQSLTVAAASGNWYSFSQSSNTGLNARAEIVKREDHASGRHRKYRARIVCGLPANTGAELVSGLREHSVEVAYTPSRVRVITITGVFTAVSTNSGRAQYEAQIAALESSVFTTLNITAANRELIEEPVADHDYNVKTLRFRRVWRELIFSQAGASNDDSAIVRQILKIDRKKEGPGDTPEARRLVTLNVEYEAKIDKTVTTDLKTKYNSIRTWIISQVSLTLQGGTVALIEDVPQFNFDENVITARLLCRGAVANAPLEHSIKLDEEFVPGWALVPAWTGDPLSKYDYQGPAVRKRTVTDARTVLGFQWSDPSERLDGGISSYAGTSIDAVQLPAGLRFHHMSSKPTFDHKRLGREGNFIDVTVITKVDVFEFFKPIGKATTVAS